MQSSIEPTPAPHVAIIMDGNGRWAAGRGLPRPAGHRAGAAAVRRIIEAAPGLGLGTLTLFAFSADNWTRPAEEVRALMGLLRFYLRAELASLARENVRLEVIGRRDRLPATLVREIAHAEAETAAGQGLHLRIALDYSARHAIAAAALRCAPTAAARGPEAFRQALDEAMAADEACRRVDLVIRTGGEQRLSDFLLWECAYAELWFTDVLWPDVTAAHLADAMGAFRRRERRFGGLTGLAASRAAR